MCGTLHNNVSEFDVTCLQVDTYLRHYFYSLNKGIPYRSGLFCVCRRRTVVLIISTMSLLGQYKKPDVDDNVLRAKPRDPNLFVT